MKLTNAVKKYIALGLCVISIGMVLFGTIMQENLHRRGFYEHSQEEFLSEKIYERLEDDAAAIYEFYKTHGLDLSMADSNLHYILLDYNHKVILDNRDSNIPYYSNLWKYFISIEDLGYEIYMHINDDIAFDSNEYVLQAYVDETFLYADAYEDIYIEVERGYNILSWIHPVTIYAALLAILSFLVYMYYEKREERTKEEQREAFKAAFSKLSNGILTNVKKIYRAFVQMFAKLSLIKRTALVLIFIVLVEFILIRQCWNNMGLFTCLWFLKSIILLTLLFSFIFDLRKLKLGGEELAAGNLEYKINTDNMFFEFKKHAENLNNLADGLAVAVEKRVQSERMKTELITNVTHDIKTPITSIINYAGLIEANACNEPKHKEYAEVLVRKATHLKRLLDDLVEASKASTGNIEMKLEDCEANVLLTQVVGEFEQRLHDSKLELITKSPDNPILIHVDSKRIWRVFENLMSNACKYSLEGSRVYLNLDQVGNEAIFSFRNTSKAMLNVSAEELMERFVRGDSSRSTEGNGLGLSIARSLTELQNGKMDIIIDGDLFKVILKFPVIS